MSQHQGYQQELHHDQPFDMLQPVTPNTSSSALTQTKTPGTGHAATSHGGPSSSFQTPVVADKAVSSSRYTPSVGDQSPTHSFSSSNQREAAGRSLSLETRPMGHGQSKPTLLLPPRSLTPSVTPVLDDVFTTTKGVNVTGKRFKRTFGVKRKESNETPYATAAVSNASPPLSTPNEHAPESILSPRSSQPPPRMSTSPSLPSQGSDSMVTSSLNPPPLSQPSASSHGRSELPSSGSSMIVNSSDVYPKSFLHPAAPGNRSSVIAVSPGISSAINFMMMDWQEPSMPRLSVDASCAAAVSPPPPGGTESSKANKDYESHKETETVRRHSNGSAPTSPEKREMKESWRKSDSTNSHHTVRANSLRASRPVSWAESFHSAYTIVPGNGGNIAPQGPSSRRLSGLISDVDFGVREEELEEDVDANAQDGLLVPSRHFATSESTQDPNRDRNLGPVTVCAPPVPHKDDKDLSKKAKRRSISLSSTLPGPVAGLVNAKPQTERSVTTTTVPAFPSTAEVRKVSYSISGMDSFRNVNHPYVHAHLRQQSENVLHQQPPAPLHSADLTQHVSPMVFSTSQLTSGSRSTQDNMSPQQSSATSNLKGRLQALLPPLPRNEPGVPTFASDSLNSPVDVITRAPTHFLPSASNSSHLRQPTLSGLGPSAAGIAKRAVERMGKRLGDMMNGLSSSSNSSVSWHSSSTSISTSASTSVTSGTSAIPSPLMDDNMHQSQVQGVPGYAIGRTASNSAPGSGHGHHHSVMHVFLPGPSKSGGHKRLQKSLGAPVALGDVSAGAASLLTLSSASTSESDPFSPTEPILGRRLRGPLKNGNAFGRELKAVVEETRVRKDNGLDMIEENSPMKVGLIKLLELRVLPAVVVRCAQHLLIWGVQEEGLFRVNGRPRHVSHLRAEFDSGADYDMTECSPSELDPHAVASVFKAYLRELPDSILTQKLQPYFDAAINRENTLHPSGHHSKPHSPSTKTHQGLPTGPRNANLPASLRKPPSLSTLAMPSFNHVPPPSSSLVNALRSLICQLPPENRDLIRTVVDLIKATAKGSKATKMPLSNLLLLFCPSLNMSPPLLRVLCDAEGIWDEECIKDISREASEEDVMAGSAGEPLVSLQSRQNMSARDEDHTDAKGDEESSLRSGRASSDNPSSLDYHASAEEDSSFLEERAALRRRHMVDRSEIPTVYLDTQSRLSSSSVSLLQDMSDKHPYTGSFLARQEMRDDGSISSGPYSFKIDNLPTSPSPPPLSSCGESISTRASSANPSFSHLPLDVDKDPEQRKRSDADLPSLSSRASPNILGSEQTDSTKVRKRPFISNPIPITGPFPVQYPFPASQSKEYVPSTPSRRRSIPLLSLSSLSNRSSGSASPSPLSKNSPYQAESRPKKPSLKLLFSKKSCSSLFESRERPSISLPLLHPPEPHFQQERSSLISGSGSDSSISTPLSAVTAPQGPDFLESLQGSSNDGPPVLNTQIEDSSLKFDDLMETDTKSIMDMPSSGLISPLLVSSTKVPISRSVSGDPLLRLKPPAKRPPSSWLPSSLQGMKNA